MALGQADVASNCAMKELAVAFSVAKTRDEEIKAKKGGDGKADNKKKAKKNAAPAPPPGIQLGRGSRALFDFLGQGNLLQSDDAIKLNVSLNKELSGELSEILQVRN